MAVTDPQMQPPAQDPLSPQPVSPQPVYLVRQVPTSGLAVGSLVLAILGLVAGCCSFGIPSALAVIFGHFALAETKNGAKGGYGMAIAGLIMGYIVVVPSVIISATWGLASIAGGTSR